MGVRTVAFGLHSFRSAQHVSAGQSQSQHPAGYGLSGMDRYRSSRNSAGGHFLLSRAGDVLAAVFHLYTRHLCHRSEIDLRRIRKHTGGKQKRQKPAPVTDVSRGAGFCLLLWIEPTCYLSSSDVVMRRRRFVFSSVALVSVCTPANSGSIMIRPQYSHTIIFLRMRISS